MNFKCVFHVIAWLLAVVGGLMGLCGVVSYAHGEPTAAWQALAMSAAGTLAAAAVLWVLTRNKRELTRRDGLGVVAFGWLLAGIAGATPFYLSGAVPTPVAALFETLSGMTTTGASVLGHLEALPKGLLLWRALTQFIGGMGVLILVVAVLPLVGVGGMQLYRAEMPGPSKDRIEPRMASTAKMLWGVYMLLTAVLLLLLRILGMSGFDALCHALTTMATGGFSTHTASIAAFDSVAIEGVLMVFMLLAGINFSLHYRALRGEVAPWWRDSEIRFFLGVFAGATLLGTLLLHQARAADGWAPALREVAFTCSSIMTTTGFVTGDYDQWPVAAKAILVLLMFMGGCAGSTAGAIKAGRIQVMLKTVTREVRLFMQPQAVIPVRMGRKLLDDNILLSILSFVSLYLFVMLVGVVVMIPLTPNIQTAVASVITCMGNVGPGFAAVGPTCNFAAIPELGKAILTLLMLVGRLELYTVLAIVMPAFWRK
ncbi:MAG: TrkH family potassium uptake protein [Kiritimatiellae bacterium]|jgi:trk system potassium uptake protein TrkH|nr:TrkH family potassium uptake protein [Kiritimatiellia bacterium]MDD4342426.1 TrkH family potassium uptake protein [Kiritimatiellia bacterium]MDY0150430.1 TrkH family potassium uptake protein [Kiritimatiellia bacterium]